MLRRKNTPSANDQKVLSDNPGAVRAAQNIGLGISVTAEENLEIHRVNSLLDKPHLITIEGYEKINGRPFVGREPRR